VSPGLPPSRRSRSVAEFVRIPPSGPAPWLPARNSHEFRYTGPPLHETSGVTFLTAGVIDGAWAHTEVAGDLLLRSAPAHGLDHGPAAGDSPVGLLMVHPS
jgi:hypothetical protein